jgi:hypothetical protein
LEYSDSACQGDDLEPGESKTFEFDDWTPDYLQYETTGSKDYMVHAEIEMEGDKNPENDIKSEFFTLDYWHDVAIANIESPDYYSGWPFYWWLRYDDATTANSFGCPDDCTFEYAIKLTSDELESYSGRGYYINKVRRHHGWETPFHMDGKIKIYGEGTSTHPGELITEEPFTCYSAGWHTIWLTDIVEISGDKDIWISCEVTHKAGQYPAGMDSSGPIDGKSDWLYINSEWVEAKDLGIYTDWNLWAGIILREGPPQPMAHIQPGTEDIDITVANFGTFPAQNLTCYAEIYEHITEPIHGTLVYEDNITDIDLIEPWGGEEILEFDDNTFAMEGVYRLFLDMPYENDDYPRNNDDRNLRIDVDGTPPVSWIEEMDPSEPDGENGWYISGLGGTICAEDPEIQPGIHGSGVHGIYVRINGGSSQFFTGKCITFLIVEDGGDILIEYWAIDNAGNEESPHSFTIDMDVIDPTIDLTYEVISGNPIQGWTLLFTATATDDTSGMDRIEFFLNGLWQKTIMGSGPEYHWSFIYHGGLNIVVTAWGFDKAGNSAYDEIVNPVSYTFILNTQQIFQSQTNSNIPKKLFVVSREGYK